MLENQFSHLLFNLQESCELRDVEMPVEISSSNYSNETGVCEAGERGQEKKKEATGLQGYGITSETNTTTKKWNHFYSDMRTALE